jgi:hypothetical protein
MKYSEYPNVTVKPVLKHITNDGNISNGWKG